VAAAAFLWRFMLLKRQHRRRGGGYEGVVCGIHMVLPLLLLLIRHAMFAANNRRRGAITAIMGTVVATTQTGRPELQACILGGVAAICHALVDERIIRHHRGHWRDYESGDDGGTSLPMVSDRAQSNCVVADMALAVSRQARVDQERIAAAAATVVTVVVVVAWCD
jgi:hypothetical protein